MTDTPAIPRGIRNNNPGNIRHSVTFTWKGEIGKDDEGFCIFVSPEFGLRAIMIIFHNYQEHEHLYTINQLIRRWAPPVENDTSDYARFVAGRLGMQPDSRVDIPTVVRPWTHAVVSYECGSDPYSLDLYSEASTLAFTQR